ncbi:MAG: lamin tail domain-containing protein [Cryomorphaceae bacterium]|nr:lamin tail domain-containing protein [Cryomorphaceae bacterium]
MKKNIFTTLFLLQFLPVFSQVLINEVMIKPGPDATSSLYQSLKMCSSSTSGSEYIELYNADPCNSVDVSCYIIGFNIFTSQSHGTFRFPAGSVIPPLGFLSIGGPNSGATINLFNYCSTPNLNTGNDRWYLENGDGYILLYNPTGVVVDAVYWTFSAGQANKWGTDSDISNAPTLIAAGSGCPSVTSLLGPSSIPIGSASYAGQGPNTGTVIERTTDGGSTWATNAAPTINSCNGICGSSSSFDLNATIVQPSCGNDNGSISFAPSPSGSYFYTWPFPSNWTVSSVSNLAPGTYPVTITNDLGCSVDTTIELIDIPCGNTCNPSGNLIVYSNYDGGILTINVDQNIPNLKVGICTYEPIQVTFTGPFVGNITQVIYAGMNSNQNNNNCGLGNFTTSITGVPSGIVTISPPMNPPPVGYTPVHGNGSGPWGGGMLGVAGLCDTTVNAGGGNTPDEVVYYFQNTTSGTLLFHQTQYACWTNQTVNISAGGNCCILPPNSNPCTPPSVPEITTAAATCAAAGTATISNYSGSLTYTFSPAGPSAGASGVISGMTPGTSNTLTASNGSCSSTASTSFSIAAQLTVPASPTITTAAATCACVHLMKLQRFQIIREH